MATITLTLEEYEALRDLAMGNSPAIENISIATVKSKPKRKVSKYGKEFGKQLKILKSKHPRTNVNGLMKKAHKLTKKILK